MNLREHWNAIRFRPGAERHHANGTEVFYLDESNTLMAVPVQTSGTQFSYGRPAKVFTIPRQEA